MNITNTTITAFSIQLHKKVLDFNCTKYDYKVPNTFNKSLNTFFEKNKFALQEYTQYSKEQTIMRLIINYFILNRNIVQVVSTKDYELFKSSLIEWKNEFSLAKTKLQEQDITAMNIYKLYIKKEIPFYVFFYYIKYLKFNINSLENELIKEKMKSVYKIILFFPNLFNKDYILVHVKEIQQYIDLSKS